MKFIYFIFVFAIGCGAQPLALTGDSDEANSLVDEVVANVNSFGCVRLVNEGGRFTVNDGGYMLTITSASPNIDAPLDVKLFLLNTPTRDRKLAVLYKQIGLMLGLTTTPDSVMQKDYSWESSKTMAKSLVNLLNESGAECFSAIE